MLRRLIKIDGDQFLLQMMDQGQVKYAKEHSSWKGDKNQPYCFKLGGPDNTQWIVDMDGHELLYYSNEKRVSSTWRDAFKKNYYALWLALLPVTKEGLPYRLDKKDFPDGSLSYGGAIHSPDNSYVQLPYQCQQKNPFPQIEDTIGAGLPWIAHDGFLLSRLPIYSCTPQMMIEEFARAAGWRKKYDWPKSSY